MPTNHQENPILNKVSVVILSDSNNPRLINPDFLEINEIVPKGWNVKDVIVTPPISRVLYENNYLIQVEEEKISFEVNNPISDKWKELLPTAATRFMEILPKVSYRSIGLNFHLSILTDNESDKFVCNNFLIDGDWKNIQGGLSGASVQLFYQASQPHFNLLIEAGTSDTSNIYICKGNFHSDFDPNQQHGRVKHIQKLSSFYDEYINLIKQLPLV